MSSFRPEPLRQSEVEEFVADPLAIPRVFAAAEVDAPAEPVSESSVEEPAEAAPKQSKVDPMAVLAEFERGVSEKAFAAGKEEGMAEGHAEGLAKGREEGASEARAELPWDDAEALRSASQGLTEAARSLANLRQGYLQENRQLVVEIACAVAEKILAREIAANPNALVGVVERALPLLGEEAPIELRVCQRDLQTIQKGLATELEALAKQTKLKLVGDENLEPGDVRLTAARTEVDARIGALLNRIREELSEIVDVREEGS